MTLDELAELLSTPIPDDGTPKNDLPLWSPASYPEGSRRGKASVSHVDLLVADIDDGTPIADALARLPARTRALAHTSYSHTPEHPKSRVILPLARPIPVALYDRAWWWLARTLGCLDPVTHDASRCYYVPVDRPGYSWCALDGDLLDLPWETLPAPTRAIPLRPPPTWRPSPDRPTWTPSPGDYPPATIELAVTRWRERLHIASLACETHGEGRRTAVLAEAWPLARLVWLAPPLADELRVAFRRATERNGRWDDNIAVLLEDILRDADTDPAPIEGVTPHAEGVALPVLVKYRTGYWVLRGDGPDYDGPTDARGVIPYMRDRGTLPRTQSGAPYSADRLLDQYGACARAVELAYPPLTSPWDPTTATLRVTRATYTAPEPVRHPDVERWLDALLSEETPEIREAVLDWLATADVLEHPTAALYLEGPRGVGKGLLVQALAAPWHTPAVPLEIALGDYPIPIAGCPIVHLDEGMALDARGTARLRTRVGERSHVLNEKHLPAVPLVGCPRHVITANNGDALGIREIRSQDDLDAIVDRILHVRVSARARDVLESTSTVGWVTADDGTLGKIPEHVAYLAATREYRPGPRWVVAGIRTSWHDQLLYRIPDYAAVLGAVLVGLGTRPHPVFRRSPDGSVRVSARTLHGQWGRLSLEDGPRPTLARVMRALDGLADVVDGGEWTISARVVGDYAAMLGM